MRTHLDRTLAVYASVTFLAGCGVSSTTMQQAAQPDIPISPVAAVTPISPAQQPVNTAAARIESAVSQGTIEATSLHDNVSEGIDSHAENTLKTGNPSNLTTVVNKRNPLPQGFVPSDLVYPNIPRAGNNQQLHAAAAAALEMMSTAAEQAVGQPLQMASGYRSYSTQQTLFNNYAAKDGVAAAERYSARPGYSEHQTGLAADLTEVGGTLSGFGSSQLGRWAAQNSWKYGFILRYTSANQGTTGYQPEPWHFRYVGTDLAAKYHNSGANSLEGFLGLPAASNYSN